MGGVLFLSYFINKGFMNKQKLQVILILLFLWNGIIWSEDTTLPYNIYLSQPLQTKITDTMKVRVSVWNPTDQTQTFQGDMVDAEGNLILSGGWDIIFEEIKEGNVIFSRSLKKNDLSSIPQYLEANGNKNWEWQVAASDLTDHPGNYRFQLKYKNLTYTGQLFRVINNLKTPEHIDIQYVTNKKTYFIGEPISLKFVIKNNGKDDFIFDTGSDYRGASRHLRFYFTATNEKGSKAIDPKPNQNWMGGLGGPISLKPGEDHEIELPLLAYLKFLTPGSYTIKGYQALGFGEPDKTIPNGSEYGMEWEYTYGNTFNITIRKPDSADIENFIQTQLLIKDTFEEQRGFSYVYDPSYLQPLLRTLKSESDEDRIKALITGIGSILTVESTQQLIALSQDDRMAVRTNALQQLFMRMPSKPNSNLSVERLKPFWRKYEIDQAWEESLRSLITKAGIIQKCLKSQSLAEVNAIARIVSLQGDPNMMPLLAQAADRIAPDIQLPERMLKQSITLQVRLIHYTIMAMCQLR
jgi:hypothetical protein